MRNIAFVLSLIVIFVIPWENVVLVDGLGTLSWILGALAAIFWLETIVVTNRLRKPTLFHLIVGLFVLWNVATLFWSIDGQRTFWRSRTYLQMFVLVLMIWDLYQTPAALKAALQAYVLGAYVSLVSVIVNYSAGTTYTYTRYSATGFNSNDIGLILVLGMPLAWYLAVFVNDTGKLRLLRPINFAYLPAALVAILLTGSRGTLVATGPVVLFVLCTLPRLGIAWRVVLVAGVIWGVSILPSVIPQASLERLATIRSSISNEDLGGRVNTWREGILLHSAHPTLGVGAGAFQAAAVRTQKVAHNVYLSILVESGIIGFAIFAGVLAVTVYNAVRQPRWAALLWMTVLMIWGIGALVHTWEQRKQTWLFLSLVTVSAHLAIPRDADELNPRGESHDLQTA
ncbi:MAG TPA: O-antigen ligase family protein [Thermoguttaceae bacterium]|nr:O-antigen ligase family protein [Thermoguttaceae bacterium]